MLLLFRHAALKDAEACAEIYRPYVEKTSVTFEYTPPDQTEIARAWIAVPLLSHGSWRRRVKR